METPARAELGHVRAATGVSVEGGQMLVDIADHRTRLPVRGRQFRMDSGHVRPLRASAPVESAGRRHDSSYAGPSLQR